MLNSQTCDSVMGISRGSFLLSEPPRISSGSGGISCVRAIDLVRLYDSLVQPSEVLNIDSRVTPN